MPQKKKSKNTPKNLKSKLLRIVMKASLAGVLLLSLCIASIFLGFFGKIPTEQDLQKINNAQATMVKDANNKTIGKFYLFDRTSITYQDFPKHLIDALVATEDSRFYGHHGIDYRSWGRVLVKTIILQQRSGGGGSTISQQLAKNLFPRERFSRFDLLVTKIKEAIIAYKLEGIYSKEEILTLYLNTVSFPDNTYGIESASNRFFSKKTKDLNTLEAAILIGSLKANYTYNPRLFPEKSKTRRNTVLALMKRHEYLSTKQFDQLKEQPIRIRYNSNRARNKAPYFVEQVRHQVQELLKANNLDYNIYTDGLIVKTTLDAGMQQHAQRALKKHMLSLQKQFEDNWGTSAPWKGTEWVDELVTQSATYQSWRNQGLSHQKTIDQMKEPRNMEWLIKGELKTVERSQIDSLIYRAKTLNAGGLGIHAQSGAIKYWVGGIDYEWIKYDHIKQSKRQVGSVFKPFVYAAALESGVDPCDYIDAKTVTYQNFKGWTPSNGTDEYDDMELSMQYALSKSINTVAVKLMEMAGVERVISLAREAGIESHLPSVPSLALGTAELSMMELAEAYTIFTNAGAPVAPYFIESISDSRGNVLYKYRAESKDKVISDYTYAIMKSLLQSVTTTGGTASRLRWKYNLTNDIGGKTGTTQSNRDGWFVAVTPRLISVNWVGADNYKVHFKDTKVGQGANTALPLFGGLYQSMSADGEFNYYTKANFRPIPTEWQDELNCDSFKEKGFIKKLFQKDQTNFQQTDSLALYDANDESTDSNQEDEEKGMFKKIKKLFKKKK